MLHVVGRTFKRTRFGNRLILFSTPVDTNDVKTAISNIEEIGKTKGWMSTILLTVIPLPIESGSSYFISFQLLPKGKEEPLDSGGRAIRIMTQGVNKSHIVDMSGGHTINSFVIPEGVSDHIMIKRIEALLENELPTKGVSCMITSLVKLPK